MKLLLDENLSYRLLTGLQPTFPQSTQVLQTLTTARERLEQLVAGGKTGVIELS